MATRRDVLAVALGALIFSPQRSGGQPAAERVAEDDKLAKTLGYRHDAASVDTTIWTKRAGAQGAAQLCSNCRYLSGDPGGEWRPCALFAGRLVNANGWCNSWLPFET